jgi:hypothetical protein
MPLRSICAAAFLPTLSADDVAKGMDIWDCVAEILFSRAHEETDPVSTFRISPD